MIPKEKAIELKDKFFDLTLNANLKDYGLERAKKCALIAVEELINAFKTDENNLPFYNQQVFWELVKQEIEKL